MKTSKLYVSNLNTKITQDVLKEMFTHYGKVEFVNLIGRTGTGFVEMSTPHEAQAAIKGLNGTEVEGQIIKVTEARSKEDKHQPAFRKFR